MKERAPRERKNLTLPMRRARAREAEVRHLRRAECDTCGEPRTVRECRLCGTS